MARISVWEQRFIHLAQEISSWSKDPSTKVGAVIVDSQNKILGTGYNGFPRGIKDDSRLLDRDIKYQMVIHAEINAILNAVADVKGTTMFISPLGSCASCASVIIQAGIKEVIAPAKVHERFQSSIEVGKQLFHEAGVALYLWEGDEIWIT